MLDLFTWPGWIESYFFFLIHTLLKSMLAGTVVAWGLAIYYALHNDLPLCVPGDIKVDIPFMGYIDVCKKLGLAEKTVITKYDVEDDDETEE